MALNPINPWVRAEEELLNHHTYALIPDQEKHLYLLTMGEYAVAGAALNDEMPRPTTETLLWYKRAQLARTAFFEGRVYEP